METTSIALLVLTLSAAWLSSLFVASLYCYGRGYGNGARDSRPNERRGGRAHWVEKKVTKPGSPVSGVIVHTSHGPN